MRTEPVDSADDSRLADYRDIQDAGLPARHALFVAESRRVVRRLLRSRFRVRSVLLTGSALEDLREELGGLPADTPVYVAAPPVIRGIVGFGFHSGCLALGERGEEPPLEALLDPGGAQRVLLVLDAIANPDNVGGIFRNAMAFGVDAVLLSPGSADPLYRRTIRVSTGTTLAVPFARLRAWPGDLVRLRTAGYTLVALTPERAAVDITALGPPAERVALLLGNEGVGLGPEARAAADVAVRIAMAPAADALNVATAAGIALHRLTGAR